MELFYSENILSTDTGHLFDKEESHHLKKVLRKKPGDAISVTDGKGLEWKGIIEKTEARNISVKKIKTILHQNKLSPLHIAIAPTKSNDRLEWFLEKSTEIGISEITPILSDHSERKRIKPERMKKILIGALKQSAQFHLPLLHPMTTFDAFINSGQNAFKMSAHCKKGRKKPLNEIDDMDRSLLVLIGPEGDFSLSEIERALEKGFKEVTLGNQRFRTETAGIVACSKVATLREINTMK